MGLPTGEGLATTASYFGGGPTWQCTMFDVMKAKNWENVVEALVSNVDVSNHLRMSQTFVFSMNSRYDK